MRYSNKQHIISWLVYSILLYLIYYGLKIDKPGEHVIVFVVLQLLAFYVNLIVLLPRFFESKKYVWFGLLNLGLLVIGGLGNTFIEEGIPQTPEENYKTFEAFLAHSVPILVGIFTAVMFHAYKQQLLREEMERKRIVAEKDFLVQQINPHFLFNVLNNIYSLTLENNPKGSEAVLQLSKMLDYSLYGNQQEYVFLKEEIRYIENFIGLFKLKDDSLLNIRFDYGDANMDNQIAPMLLLPFVENAFKHGDIETNNGTIDIMIASKKDKVEFNCTNSFKAVKKVDRVGGIGINNIKRRLQLIYPARHELSIKKNNGIHTVHLKIEVNEA